MDPIRFLLNGEPCEVHGLSPTITVLEWLREQARLTGTKEGCGEGDCGACTIAVADAEGGRLRWRAVNSCLMVMPQLDGRAVLTVEGLAAADGPLHPVQAALVETDGTQCGFCTPGFVMSLFAFQHGGEPAEESLIHDALAGNLCRCTGYRPIVEAAAHVAGRPANGFDEASFAAQVAGIGARSDFSTGEQRFHAPDSLEALVRLYAETPDAHLLAGGTDLGLLVSKERQRLPAVILTTRVPELRRLRRFGGWLEIGAAVTYADALPEVAALWPSFGRLLRRLGSRQIRNLGTFGGNLGTASPIGDALPCLLALDARILVRSAAGAREVAADDFFRGYRTTALTKAELIEAIRLPLPRPGEAFRAYKVSKRYDQDISAVVGAYRLRVDGGTVADVRIAYGGMAAVPKRATAAEAALRGRPWTQAALADIDAAIAADFAPLSDHRASAAYRMTVAANLVRRLQLDTAGGAHPVTVDAL
jgi:xanthine dehydrogenase small subunit